MSKQRVLSPRDSYIELDQYFREAGAARIFLVCGGSFRHLALNQYFQALPERTGIQITYFSAFHANPDYESVLEGRRYLRGEQCNLIAAAGGGSAIDVAKCIRRLAGNGVPLLAVPTTAGSGSEATHFAVVYRQGVKASVDCGTPDAVLLDPSLLDTLPLHQRKATMLDALCHGIESFWSIRSTPESRDYSKHAIRQIMNNYQGYLDNTPGGNAGMLWAAHLAGKAINIAQTTAGHAMSYQITKLYGLAHGHAAALCLSKIWPWMLERSVQLPYGLADAMGCGSLREGAQRFQAIVDQLELEVPTCTQEELAALTASVNPERMKNLPVVLCLEDIKALYRQILRMSHES